MPRRKPTKKRTQRGKARTDDVKAQVTAALLLGDGVMEIADRLGIPHSTVSTYKSQIPSGKLDELRRKKGERLDELVYDYAVANLVALTAQARVTSESSYIRRQPAGSLAILHGVLSDKTVRLLEAITRAEQRQIPESTGA